MSHVVRGRALECRGRLDEARAAVDRSVELARGGVASVETGYSLLSQAEIRQLQGEREAAVEVLREARGVVADCPRPGILADMVERTQRRLRPGREGGRTTTG